MAKITFPDSLHQLGQGTAVNPEPVRWVPGKPASPLLAHWVDATAGALAYTPKFLLYDYPKALVNDQRRFLLHGDPSQKNTLAIGRGMFKGVESDFKDPINNLPFLASDVLGLLTGGASTVARGVVAAGRVGDLAAGASAAEKAAAAAKGFVARPQTPVRTLRIPGGDFLRTVIDPVTGRQKEVWSKTTPEPGVLNEYHGPERIVTGAKATRNALFIPVQRWADRQRFADPSTRFGRIKGVPIPLGFKTGEQIATDAAKNIDAIKARLDLADQTGARKKDVQARSVALRAAIEAEQQRLAGLEGQSFASPERITAPTEVTPVVSTSAAPNLATSSEEYMAQQAAKREEKKAARVAAAEDHPDVVAAKSEIDAIQGYIDNMRSLAGTDRNLIAQIVPAVADAERSLAATQAKLDAAVRNASVHGIPSGSYQPVARTTYESARAAVESFAAVEKRMRDAVLKSLMGKGSTPKDIKDAIRAENKLRASTKFETAPMGLDASTGVTKIDTVDGESGIADIPRNHPLFDMPANERPKIIERTKNKQPPAMSHEQYLTDQIDQLFERSLLENSDKPRVRAFLAQRERVDAIRQRLAVAEAHPVFDPFAQTQHPDVQAQFGFHPAGEPVQLPPNPAFAEPGGRGGRLHPVTGQTAGAPRDLKAPIETADFPVGERMTAAEARAAQGWVEQEVANSPLRDPQVQAARAHYADQGIFTDAYGRPLADQGGQLRELQRELKELEKKGWNPEPPIDTRHAAVKTVDAVNQLTTMAMLFLKPAYLIGNGIGQVGLNLIQHHFNPVELGRTLRMQARMFGQAEEKTGVGRVTSAGTYIRKAGLQGDMADLGSLIRAGMGETIMGSIVFKDGIRPAHTGTSIFSKAGHRFSHGVATAHKGMADWYGSMLDTPFRDIAFFKEARNAGYRSPEQVRQLLTDPALRDDAARVFLRAGRAIIDYGGLNKVERAYIRRIIIFYPWVKGSTNYAKHYVREHPVGAMIHLQQGRIDQKQAVNDLGPIASYLEGTYKTGTRMVPGLGRVPTVANPASVSLLGTPAQLVSTIARNVVPGSFGGGVRSADQVSGMANPLVSALIAGATRVDPFTKRKFDSNTSTQRVIGESLASSAAPYTLYKRVFGKQPDPTTKVFPDQKTDAWGQFLIGGTSGRAYNTVKGTAQASAESLGSLDPLVRIGFVADQKKSLIADEMSKYKLISGGELPQELTDALQIRTERRINLKRAQQENGGKSNAQQRLQADLSFMVSKGLLTEADAQSVADSLKGAGDKQIDGYRSAFSDMLGGSVISAYSSTLDDLGGKGSVLK